MLHVLPIDDLKEHEESTACHCGPRVIWVDEETGEAYSEGIVVHRSFDGREAVEEAERL